ncbi:MAG: hypothetical protein RMN24_02790, partial [Anaerolineae bacterium]|nr:hypothetical protein [Anaerolineae bacterium]
EGVNVFGGMFLAAGQYEPEMMAAVVARIGAEVQPIATGTGWWSRFARFWEDGYTRALIWTYNPGSLRGRRGDRRYYILISRASLLRRGGGEGGGLGGV